MAKNAGSGAGRPAPEVSSSGKGVVDLADARVRLRSRSRATSNQDLLEELDEVRSLLDQGLSAEARTRLASLITAARDNPSILALARCALSTALEMQGNYRESLAAVAMYESPESRDKLDPQAVKSLKVQIGLAYNYNGDHPKAISFLKGTLREFSESGQENNLVPFMRLWPASTEALASIQSRLITRNGRWSISVKPANGAVSQKHILALR